MVTGAGFQVVLILNLLFGLADRFERVDLFTFAEVAGSAIAH